MVKILLCHFTCIELDRIETDSIASNSITSQRLPEFCLDSILCNRIGFWLSRFQSERYRLSQPATSAAAAWYRDRWDSPWWIRITIKWISTDGMTSSWFIACIELHWIHLRFELIRHMTTHFASFVSFAFSSMDLVCIHIIWLDDIWIIAIM